MKKNYEGLFTSPLFICLGLDKRKFELENIRVLSHTFIAYIIEDYVCNKVSKYANQVPRNDLFQIIRRGLIDYYHFESLFSYICSDDEIAKIEACIKRGQYNSKIVISYYTLINNILCSFINNNSFNFICEYIYPRLEIKIRELCLAFINEEVIKKYSVLKNEVDKCASGVKADCYLKFEFCEYNEDLLKYINDKYGYSCDDLLYCLFDENNCSSIEVLGNILAPKTFKSNHDNLLRFASNVCKYNGLKHAQKIIDYAFEKASEKKFGKIILDNHLPIVFIESLDKYLINYYKSRLNYFAQSSNINLNDITNDEYNGFLYPFIDVFEEYINKGKMLFNNLIESLYKENSAKVIELLTDTKKEINDKGSTLENYYENTFLENQRDAVKTLSVIFPDYSSNQNILNRLYYRIYLIHKVSQSNAVLYEYLYYPLTYVDELLGIENQYVNNISLRNNKYNLLKQMLANYDLHTSEEFKDKYIISLLDRKYAKHYEAELFPVYEQTGDAIFNLACANILFYNKKTRLTFNSLTEYVNAKSQSEIAFMLKINDMYISELKDELRFKYDDNYYDYIGHYNKGYLADSLEMIIGVISLEFGISKALAFSEQIILETYKELNTPTRLPLNFLSKEIDLDYLSKIYPYPFLNDEYETPYYEEYMQLQYVLVKVLNIFVYGNETKEKRKAITVSFNDYINKDVEAYKLLCNYLYNGIVDTINKLKQ